MKLQIDFDIAWQIFDEVNLNNDTDKLVDLNCLLPDDDLLDSFKVSPTELPVLYLLEAGDDSLTPFPGEVS